MTVDTAAMRKAEGQLSYSKVCDLLRSAADEIDELRSDVLSGQEACAALDAERSAHAETKQELALSRESEASLLQQLTLAEVARDASREAYEKAIVDLESLRQSAQEATAHFTKRISEEVDPLKHALREETKRRESAETLLLRIRQRKDMWQLWDNEIDDHFARFGGQHD